jgi:hypothetical protein
LGFNIAPLKLSSRTPNEDTILRGTLQQQLISAEDDVFWLRDNNGAQKRLGDKEEPFQMPCFNGQ